MVSEHMRSHASAVEEINQETMLSPQRKDAYHATRQVATGQMVQLGNDVDSVTSKLFNLLSKRSTAIDRYIQFFEFATRFPENVEDPFIVATALCECSQLHPARYSSIQYPALVVRAGETRELASDTLHIFLSIFIEPTGVLTVAPWDGRSGGVLNIATDDVDIEGTVTVSGKGYRGGSVNDQGESSLGRGTIGYNVVAPNDGGGGAGSSTSIARFTAIATGGGGGGFANAGFAAVSRPGGKPGNGGLASPKSKFGCGGGGGVFHGGPIRLPLVGMEEAHCISSVACSTCEDSCWPRGWMAPQRRRKQQEAAGALGDA